MFNVCLAGRGETYIFLCYIIKFRNRCEPKFTSADVSHDIRERERAAQNTRFIYEFSESFRTGPIFEQAGTELKLN